MSSKENVKEAFLPKLSEVRTESGVIATEETYFWGHQPAERFEDTRYEGQQIIHTFGYCREPITEIRIQGVKPVIAWTVTDETHENETST